MTPNCILLPRSFATPCVNTLGRRKLARVMATTSVTVQLDLDTARALHGGTRSAATIGVQRVTDELGITLKPQHPGQTHQLLLPFFVVDAPDRATAERIARRLREAPGVEGAWVPPSPAAP